MIDIREAKRIISEHQAQSDFRIATVPIARALGLNVYRVKSWENSLSGMIKKDKEHGGESGYAIFVNANHPENRRRFTIAHEIAHFVLHGHLIGDGITDDGLYRSGLTSAVETQANQMAADILMPWDKIIKAMERQGGANSVEELAQLFGVSKSSMSIRLGVPYE